MTRSPTEWYQFAAGRYSEIKKPNWRVAVPSKTQTQSQKRIWRACFHFARINPGPSGEDTSALMRRFIHHWMTWAKGQPDDYRVTIWTSLNGFMEQCEGPAPEPVSSPEVAVRAALKPLPKRAQLHLLIRLMGEIA